jgi:PPOX class probable F420-dependent enzyme
VDQTRAVAEFGSARVARLATIRGDGAPHLVPVTFAVLPASTRRHESVGVDVIVTVVDEKPKSTRDLLRLHNIAGTPHVCFLVDHYANDWSTLWWVRADALAVVLDERDSRRDTALAALVAKYPQYQEVSPTGAVVRAEVSRWTWWSAADGSGPPRARRKTTARPSAKPAGA